MVQVSCFQRLYHASIASQFMNISCNQSRQCRQVVLFPRKQWNSWSISTENSFQSMTGWIRLTELEEEETPYECTPFVELHCRGLVQWNFIMENPFPVKGLDKVRLDIQSVWISSKIGSEQLMASHYHGCHHRYRHRHNVIVISSFRFFWLQFKRFVWTIWTFQWLYGGNPFSYLHHQNNTTPLIPFSYSLITI